MIKKLEEYLKKEYEVELYPIETDKGDISWSAQIPDLPGCGAGGDTKEEALKNVEDAKRAWISFALEQGKKIPDPSGLDEYSGKFTLRIPKSLHRDLKQKAKREGMSLNKYVMFLVTKNHYKQMDSDQYETSIEINTEKLTVINNQKEWEKHRDKKIKHEFDNKMEEIVRNRG